MDIAKKIYVRKLSEQEIARFEAAIKNELETTQSLNGYSEEEALSEGLWVMSAGMFSQAFDL